MASHASSSAPATDPSSPLQADRPMLAVTLAVIILATLRCLVAVFPEVYWDVDPRSPAAGMDMPLLGVGPVGSAVIDTLSVLAAGAALILHNRRGGRLAWKTTLLALVGAGVCAWQMTRHVPGMMTHASWLASICLAVAMFHLAQHARSLRWITASLVALALPFLLRSLVYVLWEHPMTLEMFRRNEAQNVAARGWGWESPQHLLYRRRMEFPDVTGAFGLSNIFGSVTAAVTLAALGILAVMLLRKRFKQAWVPAISAVAGAGVLYLTHAKGPVLAAIIGCGLLTAAMLALWRWRRLGATLAPLALAGVVAASGLVLARASLGPPDSEAGERSLLFRAQYWEGAWRIITHQSWAGRLLGVGAGPFKDHYSQCKNPLNPEEVTSTHNVFVDLVTMMGVGGVAWSALFITWLWMAGRGTHHLMSAADEPADDPSASSLQPNPSDVKWALGLGVAAFGFQFYTLGQTMLTPESFLCWGLSLACYVGVAAALVNPAWVSRQQAALALFLAGAVLLIHAQVEMTFFNMQAAPLVFGVLAASAGAGMKRQSTDRMPSVFNVLPVLAASGALLVVMVGWNVLPATRQQAALKEAAVALRQQRVGDSLQALDRAAAALPRDPRPYISKTMLLMEVASHYARQNQPAPAQQFISQAMLTLDNAYAAGLRDIALLRCRAQAVELAGELTNDPGRTATAINLWTNLMDRTPFNLNDALHLADLLWAAGQTQQAKAWYGRTMQIHRDSYLDSARQLTPDQLAQVKARLEG